MYGNGYSHRNLLTVDGSKVAAAATGFISLVDITLDDLKSVANGGHVHQNPVLDIRFEDTFGNKLAHEIHKYDPVAGRVIAWVRHDIDTTTTLYIYYGKDIATPYTDMSNNWSQNNTGGVGVTGIIAGYGESNISAVRNSNAITTDNNIGEVYIYCSLLTYPDGTVATLSGNAYPLHGAESGSPWYSYVMYHTAATAGRFSVPAGTHPDMKLVMYDGTNWKYDTNGTLVNFTPASTDMLIARIKWGGAAGFEVIQPFRAGEENLPTLWTWDEYAGVYHFEDPSDGTANYFEHRDMSWYSHTGSSWGSMNSADLVAGKVNNGIDLDGSNDYVVLAHPGAVDQVNSLASIMAGDTTYSWSGWFKTSSTKSAQLLFAVNTGTGGNVMLTWMNATGNIGIAGQAGGSPAGDVFSSVGGFNDGQWHHFHYNRSGTNHALYIDGVSRATKSGLSYTLSANDRWSIGQEWDTNTASDFFQGQLDEYRIERTAPAATTILTRYNNQNNPSTFWSVGTTQYALQTLMHTEDTLLRKEVPIVDTIDTLLRKNVALTHYIDALLRKRYDLNTSSDAFLRARLFATHSIDSSLAPPLGSAVTHNVDTLLKYRFDRTHTIDASVSLRFTPTTSTDTLLRRRVEASQTVNALLRKNVAITNAIDALLKGVITKEQAIDTLLRYRHQTQQSIDVLLSKRVLLSTTFDTQLHTANYAIQTIDAYLICRKPFTGYDDLDKPPTSFEDEILIATTYEGQSKPKTSYSMDSKAKTNYNDEQKPKTAYKGC